MDAGPLRLRAAPADTDHMTGADRRLGALHAADVGNLRGMGAGAGHGCYFGTYLAAEMVEVAAVTTEQTKRPGRPPLPEGQARTDTLRTMVKPGTGEAFRRVAKARGYTVSEALHEAATDWVLKHS